MPRIRDRSVSDVRSKSPIAFIELRKQLAVRDSLAKRLDQIERKLLRHDTALQELYKEIKAPREIAKVPDRAPIGFRTDAT